MQYYHNLSVFIHFIVDIMQHQCIITLNREK